MRKLDLSQNYDNYAAHQQLLALMRGQRRLNIKLMDNAEARISASGISELCYQLTAEGWRWLLNYLRTGGYEDCNVRPEEATGSGCGFHLAALTQMVEEGDNVTRVPNLREQSLYVSVRVPFKMGVLILFVARTNELTNFLIANNL